MWGLVGCVGVGVWGLVCGFGGGWVVPTAASSSLKSSVSLR